MSEHENEPRIVAAVGTAVVNLRDKSLAKLLEAAEVQAITDCLAEGVSVHDADTIIARKRDYRARAKAAYYGSILATAEPSDV